MDEQRLIDANHLGVGKANPDVFERKDYAYGWNSALQAVANATQTIDPETLPIVCQLRAELDNLRKEKRPTATLVKSTFGVCCSRCKTECSPQWVACPVCGAEIKKEDANDQS